MWYLLFALLQPFIKALRDDNATLLLLHRGPHALILGQGIVSTVNGLHHGSIVGIALRPERDKSPFHGL